MFLKTVDEYTQDQLMREIVKLAAQGKLTVNAAQAAIWRIANKLEWGVIGRQKTLTGGRMTSRDLTLASTVLTATEKKLADTPQDHVAEVATQPSKTDDSVYYTMTFNPDPRGSKLGGQLVRSLATNYQPITGHKVEVDHANYMPAPIYPNLAVLHWNVLIRAPAQIKGRYLLTLLGSQWDPEAKTWRHGKLTEVRFDPPTKVPAGTELTKWFAQSLAQTLTGQMIESGWTPRAGKKKITLRNRFPFSVASVGLVDELRPENTLMLDDANLEAGEEKVYELTDAQSKAVARTRKLVVTQFKRSNEKKIASNMKPTR